MQNHRENLSLNLNIRGLPKSATLAVNELSNQLIRDGRVVYKLGLGQSPFPVPQPVVEALKTNAHQKDYLPVKGLRQLREAVARFHATNDGIHADPDRVMIGPGSKELLFLLQMTYYGDLVVPTPCWVSYAPQARILGRRVTMLPTTFEQRWRLRPEALEDLCREDPGRPRIVVLNYPGNPDGATYRDETLRAIAEVARRYEVILLSDEIYGKLDHSGAHVSIARYYPEGTIISSGISKWCGAGGWRLGTFLFPENMEPLLESMASVASETFTSTSAPIQYAAVRAFDGGYRLERYLAHARRILSALGQWCAARLREAGARVLEPQGAFYLFPDFTPLTERFHAAGIRTSTQLCARLLADTGVATLPGVDFGREPDELTLRLAYVDFDGARTLTASEHIPLAEELDESFLHDHCHRTTAAMNLLGQWVTGLKP